jgi:hypothetical protein
VMKSHMPSSCPKQITLSSGEIPISFILISEENKNEKCFMKQILNYYVGGGFHKWWVLLFCFVLLFCVISISAFYSSNRTCIGWRWKCFFRHYSMCLCKIYQINKRSLTTSNPVLIFTYRITF